MNLILASQSPRRVELLRLICPDFQTIPSHAQEIIPPGLTPEQAVCHLSALKAAQVASQHPESLVIGADTVVTIDNQILGKPVDRQDCCRMLEALSGRTHQVCTGVTLLRTGSQPREERFAVTTQVECYPLSSQEIHWYASTQEPYDKAGGYGIQGLGSLLIREIRGDYYNVMGFPVSTVWRRLRRWGLALPQ